jgi:ABC-type multidrug transport system ATPase subunit
MLSEYRLTVVKNVSAPTHSVHASHLAKTYGNRYGLRDANLEVGDREVFALMGPNGAGKSTLLRILATLTRPTNGEAKICGYDLLKEPQTVRRLIGAMLHQSILYDELTGRENLSFYLRLYGFRERMIVRELIAKKAAIFGLEDRLDDRVGTLSSGLKKRLDIVRATIHGTRLILLDEPFAGLDPEGEECLKNYLKHAKDNSAILFTTHSLDIAEETSDNIGMLKDGAVTEVRHLTARD